MILLNCFTIAYSAKKVTASPNLKCWQILLNKILGKRTSLFEVPGDVVQQVDVGDDANDDLLVLHFVASHVWKRLYR